MTKFDEQDCSVLKIVDLLGKKWIVHIISELLKIKEISFNELQEGLINKADENISARILSLSLKLLENENIINREVDINTRGVKYSLTEKGKELEVVLALLKGWSVKWDEIKHKKCKSFSCIHDSVPIFPINKVLEIYSGIAITRMDVQNN